MFTLVELPYKSLAPVIGDETLALHHGRHLQTYVDNLNKLLPGTEFEALCNSGLCEESVLGDILRSEEGKEIHEILGLLGAVTGNGHQSKNCHCYQQNVFLHSLCVIKGFSISSCLVLPLVGPEGEEG